MVLTIVAFIGLSGSICAEESKEREWSGTVHARAVDKKDPALKPYLRVEGQIKLLTGPNVASLDECKKDRIWVVKGKESANEKSIEVREMKERMDWMGEVKVANIGDNNAAVAVLNYKSGYGLELKGKIASMDECKKKDWWSLKGRLSDDLKSLEVTEMKKIPKPDKKDDNKKDEKK